MRVDRNDESVAVTIDADASNPTAVELEVLGRLVSIAPGATAVLR